PEAIGGLGGGPIAGGHRYAGLGSATEVVDQFHQPLIQALVSEVDVAKFECGKHAIPTNTIGTLFVLAIHYPQTFTIDLRRQSLSNSFPRSRAMSYPHLCPPACKVRASRTRPHAPAWGRVCRAGRPKLWVMHRFVLVGNA